MEMESYLLPEDVITEIIAMLPVKSLMRFKCVDKARRDLISSSSFSMLHSDRNKSKPLSYIQMSETRIQLFTDGGKHTSDLHCPFMHDLFDYDCVDDEFMVGSSSNGLVCFRGSIDPMSIIIWNPATRESRYIPTPTDLNIFWIEAVIGFDIRPCGDYRVVVIVLSDKGEVKAEMHSKSSSSWKKICTDVPASAMKFRYSMAVTVNRWMYWLTYEIQNLECFDMWEEKYRQISLPFWGGFSRKLAVVNGSSLGLFILGEGCGYDIWVMNGQDQSWTKDFSGIQYYNSMGQLPSTNEMVTIIVDQHVRFFHHATKQFVPFPVISRYIEAAQYKESLFSVYNSV